MPKSAPIYQAHAPNQQRGAGPKKRGGPGYRALAGFVLEGFPLPSQSDHRSCFIAKTAKRVALIGKPSRPSGGGFRGAGRVIDGAAKRGMAPRAAHNHQPDCKSAIESPPPTRHTRAAGRAARSKLAAIFSANRQSLRFTGRQSIAAFGLA